MSVREQVKALEVDANARAKTSRADPSSLNLSTKQGKVCFKLYRGYKQGNPIAYDQMFGLKTMDVLVVRGLIERLIDGQYKLTERGLGAIRYVEFRRNKFRRY